MPRYDVADRHEILIAAPPARAYRCARDLDIGRLPLSRALFALRGIPHLLTGSVRPSRRMTLDDMVAAGFVVLGERVSEEIVFGVVGRFWRPASGIVRVSASEFASYAEPGHARAAMAFRVDRARSGCRLRTETRVDCLDDAAWWRFRLYWAVVGPFSALIRRELLRAIRRDAEDVAPPSFVRS
jgi:hypothetical protein